MFTDQVIETEDYNPNKEVIERYLTLTWAWYVQNLFLPLFLRTLNTKRGSNEITLQFTDVTSKLT